MQRRTLILASGATALGGALGALALLHQRALRAPLPLPEPVYEVPRQVRYRFTVSNPSPRPVPGVDLQAFAPLARTAHQLVERIEVSAAYEAAVVAVGNRRLRFALPLLAPYATREVSVSAALRLALAPNRLPRDDLTPYLKPAPLVESEATEIQHLAREQMGGTPLATAQRLHQWVAGHLRYAGYLREARGALYALMNRRGDCTEYAALFTALARASGLPARVMSGFVTSEDAVLRARDFHNWAEFFAEGRWHLCDPQKDVFMEQSDRYVAFQILGVEGEDLNARRFFVSPPPLKARMY